MKKGDLQHFPPDIEQILKKQEEEREEWSVIVHDFTRWLDGFDEYELEILSYELSEYKRQKFPSKPKSRTELLRRELKYRTKKQVLEKDAYRCRKCGSHKNLHVDHIVPVSKGGTNDLENLQTLCGTCNIKKGAKND